ncbi:5-dehydro-4-deoxy-D-glucuronate isomerase [Chengkuizengella axinellae]|uniref:4-deoxy-L-threo-5-hexosulose-uronate ketol-isomerase n=1 Tax=Chengkuizengella axinellae TaxID=3064388 RepID=A0ABT9ITD2_9BACL|nr:5-dehydro-4-deoxy-D-glucuronate isomerase [Chengkuizengella sp. 2205SS18-9]MDP5272614.1 5-dehydro-4-deoxy-D-glucuronate isomerase [Chengkuizengella sp. 2205SS18-9]
MEVRHASHPEDVKQFDTNKLRERFLIEDLFVSDQVNMVYSHYDRMIVGGAQPVDETLTLDEEDTLKTEFFLERREIGFINIGGLAVLEIDGESYELSRLDALYVGKGKEQVKLSSIDPNQPAKLYFCSCPAHEKLPIQKATIENANPLNLGSKDACNERTIYQYIHEGGLQSCQLMLGLTILKLGSIWNTMPAHLHDRRMEAYLYFDLEEQARVLHLMGEPNETRHIIVKNEQAVISPSWSIHSGSGTSNYSFIWAMAGENYTFKDMDMVNIEDLK